MNARRTFEREIGQERPAHRVPEGWQIRTMPDEFGREPVWLTVTDILRVYAPMDFVRFTFDDGTNATVGPHTPVFCRTTTEVKRAAQTGGESGTAPLCRCGHPEGAHVEQCSLCTADWFHAYTPADDAGSIDDARQWAQALGIELDERRVLSGLETVHGACDVDGVTVELDGYRPRTQDERQAAGGDGCG
ncbi:hypothetical protein [Streptomyces synnematoformans]|uniref:Uncharacterized protein n=1 Tax=Streptomyces synnematoformans TaxID=415721 RepID=A0ABP5IWW7_9ACTN